MPFLLPSLGKELDQLPWFPLGGGLEEVPGECANERMCYLITERS